MIIGSIWMLVRRESEVLNGRLPLTIVDVAIGDRRRGRLLRLPAVPESASSAGSVAEADARDAQPTLARGSAAHVDLAVARRRGAEGIHRMDREADRLRGTAGRMVGCGRHHLEADPRDRRRAASDSSSCSVSGSEPFKVVARRRGDRAALLPPGRADQQPRPRPAGGDQDRAARHARPDDDRRRGRPRLRRRDGEGGARRQGPARRGAHPGAAGHEHRPDSSRFVPRTASAARAPRIFVASSAPSSRPTRTASRSATCSACRPARCELKRRQRAEEQAQKITVKILFPLDLLPPARAVHRHPHARGPRHHRDLLRVVAARTLRPRQPGAVPLG